MGVLDSQFSLPTAGAIPDQTVNYTLPDSNTLVNEGFAAVKNRYSGVGPFSSLNVGAPSFATLGANYQLGTISPSSPYLSTAAAVAKQPTNNAASAKQINNAVGSNGGTDDTHKIRLWSYVDDVEVLFENMPTVQEQRSADYEPLAIVQMPGEFQKYIRTKSTIWTINATFVCRTTEEATARYNELSTLRGWLMPYFGTNLSATDKALLGAPPPVLGFSGWRGLVGEVPVVITAVNWSWPKEVDWIPTSIVDPTSDSTGRVIPFPTVMEVTISLLESFSPNQFSNFNLDSFKNGDMIGAFSSQSVVRSSATVAEASVTPVSIPVSSTAGGGRGFVNPDTVKPPITVAEVNNNQPSSPTVTPSVPAAPSTTELAAIKQDKIDTLTSQIATTNTRLAGQNTAVAQYTSLISTETDPTIRSSLQFKLQTAQQNSQYFSNELATQQAALNALQA